MKPKKTFLICALLSWGLAALAAVEVKNNLTAPVALSGTDELHLTAKDDVMAKGATVTLGSADAWLFFDHVKPNDVIKRYASQILIGGEAFDPESNGRIVVYKQGAVVMAHPRGMCVLKAITAQGKQVAFEPEYYYSNQPSAYVPSSLAKPLACDNALTHISLKRGYMATLACEPDGMGYSRVFIADDKDLDIALPTELRGKVSFVRVLPWFYPNKKGWAGSVWKTMPDGLKYCFQQCDLTNSTWYYNWGMSPTTDPARPDDKNYNQEFVPEKWGAGGNPTTMFTLPGAPHLIGFNEPDHTEQSNVSVETAIKEWPLLLQTGRRLGSPATTDFNWLYNFMSQCKKRNYRVDYVVVHAYWGGKSASEWYRDLKAVHDRTKRPIWIKEWNNGANWTKETWPSGQADQYAKQLRDLQAIVNMLDTCSFIERYSIYNWVEDKRMIIDSKGKLTPAGEFYADDQPSYFFNRSKEVVPVWNIQEAPVLAYDSVAGGRLHLSWTDPNGEQIDRYAFYKDGQIVTDTLHGLHASLPVTEFEELGTSSTLKVQSIPEAVQNGKESNSVTVSSMADSQSDVVFGESLVWQDWQPMIAQRTTVAAPVTLLGTATYRNKMPLSPVVRKDDAGHFDFCLRPWLYQQHPSFYAPDTLTYVRLPRGRFQWGAIKGEANDVDKVDNTWVKVRFTHAFDVQPIVIATAHLSSDTTATAAVRNVTKTGFETCLRFEGKLRGARGIGKVAYVAVTPGKGKVGGRVVVAGLTPDRAVADYLSGGYRLKYGETFAESPLVFAQVQTENDIFTATLRQDERSSESTLLFKDREKSVSGVAVEPEQVGFIVVGRQPTADFVQTIVAEGSPLTYTTMAGISLPSAPKTRGMYIVQSQGVTVKKCMR